ncbi:hypothetical protein ACU686_05360 [Yinghuangia aomiensis]
MKAEVDRPVEPGEIELDNGFTLDMHPHFFDDGTFTNSYDLSWAPEDARAAMRITPRPESMLVHAPGVSQPPPPRLSSPSWMKHRLFPGRPASISSSVKAEFSVCPWSIGRPSASVTEKSRWTT